MPEREPEREPEPAPGPAAGWRWGVGAHAGGTGALGDGVALSVPLFASLELDGDTLLRPALRVALNLAPPHAVALNGTGSATRWRLSGRLEGCPIQLQLVTRLDITPCAALEAGAIVSQSQQLAENLDTTAPWVAARGSARVRFELFDGLLLEAEGGFGGALLRPRYFVDPLPEQDALSTPALFGVFAGGALVRFP